MLKKRWQKVVAVVLGYLLVSCVFVALFFATSIVFLKQQKLNASFIAAGAARGWLLPLQVVTAFQSNSLRFIDLNLQLVQETKNLQTLPAFFKQRWENTNNPTQTEIDQLISISNKTSLLIDHLNQNVEQKPLIVSLLAKIQADRFQEYQHTILTADQLSSITQPFVSEYSSLSGFPNQQKTYLIMLQNNMELRPTGGFLGSYALVTFSNGNLQSLEVEDIYFPDGQLYGHVDPPQPIQDAFLQGFWKLRDANWHPDFAESAKNVEWFFEEATIDEIDGILAINFTTIEKLLQIIGPLYLPEFQQTVTADDMYVFLEIEGEKDFVPGSTKKRELLSSLQKQVIQKIGQLSPSQYLQLATLLTTEVEHKEIQAFFHDAQLQTITTNLGLSGELQNQPCQTENCFADYFAIFDANVGVNKTNCCVERQVEIAKTTTNDLLSNTVSITYKHLGPQTEVAKQFVGHYKAYSRMYLPPNTVIQKLTMNDKPYELFMQNLINQQIFDPQTQTDFSVSSVKGFVEIGFWTWVEIGETVEVKLETQTFIQSNQPYQLSIQKQSGTQDFYNQLNVYLNEAQLFSGILQSDQTLQL